MRIFDTSSLVESFCREGRKLTYHLVKGEEPMLSKNKQEGGGVCENVYFENIIRLPSESIGRGQ